MTKNMFVIMAIILSLVMVGESCAEEPKESAKVTDAQRFGAGAAEGTLCATQWAEDMSYKDPMFGSAGDYTKMFEKEYKYVPPYQAAESTAAVYVYARALEMANSFDTEKIREALANYNEETFYGKVKFAPEGNNIAKPMVLRQIQNNKYVPVAPSKFAAGEVIFPKPKWKDR